MNFKSGINRTKTTPDLLEDYPSFSALQSMDIIIRMETALAGEGNMVIYALKKAIADKRPANLIIRTTQEMIRDNYNAIAAILGTSLTDRIRNHVI